MLDSPFLSYAKIKHWRPLIFCSLFELSWINKTGRQHWIKGCRFENDRCEAKMASCSKALSQLKKQLLGPRWREHRRTEIHFVSSHYNNDPMSKTKHSKAFCDWRKRRLPTLWRIKCCLFKSTKQISAVFSYL